MKQVCLDNEVKIVLMGKVIAAMKVTGKWRTYGEQLLKFKIN